MSYHVDLDTRSADCRGYVPRHGIPDPVVPPPWAVEPTGMFRLTGECPTKPIVYPPAVAEDLQALRLPSRHPQKARWWGIWFGPLGQALAAAKKVFR